MYTGARGDETSRAAPASLEVGALVCHGSAIAKEGSKGCADPHEPRAGVTRESAVLGGKPDKLTAEESLYDAGMTSHASVSVMLALEDTFDIEFPDSMLSRRVFESIASIRDAVEELRESVDLAE